MHNAIIHTCAGCNHELEVVETKKTSGKRTLLSCKNPKCLLYNRVMKLCPGCQKIKENTAENFYKRSGSQGDFLTKCKPCHCAHTTPHTLRRQKEHPEIVAVYSKRWADKHPEKVREKYLRQRLQKPPVIRRSGSLKSLKKATTEHLRHARNLNLESDFTLEDWQNALSFFNGTCAYCGKQQTFWESLEQEHFTPLAKGGGYTRKNIVPSCKGCNSSKSNNDPYVWLVTKFGKPTGEQVFNRIQTFFASVETGVKP